jgi:hypothetical protein
MESILTTNKGEPNNLSKDSISIHATTKDEIHSQHSRLLNFTSEKKLNLNQKE